MSLAVADRELGLGLLKQMLRIRRFEEKCVELYSASKIRGFLHVYIGEEAVAAGVMAALKPEDAVLSTYREHGHALARGIPARSIMAEMFARVSGTSRGRGGSMHIFDAATRFYGGSAIVAGGIPVAVGLALADKLMGRKRVTACFFGEGAMAEGEFHESMNLAALWELPVLFCCENNLYAMGTALERSESETDLALKASAYRMPAWPVDGMDVMEVNNASREAVEQVRSGAGPCFLEFRTYRFRAHSMYDPDRYRDKEEVRAWKTRDPIPAFSARLETEGLLGVGELASVEKEIEAEIDEAVAFAESSPIEPLEDLTRFVYSEPAGDTEAPPPSVHQPAQLSYREALREAIRRAMLKDERVFLMGEDVGRYGGSYAVTLGLLEELGPERIRDTPLSESAFVGAGIGAALGGMLPIVEIMTVNFSLLALDQLINNAATILHMSGGQFNVPVVIRMTTGAGRQLAAQHSHSFEGWFAHIAGLKILAPATPEDARGMLLAALADPDPVLLFEHGALYNMSGDVFLDGPPANITRAAVRRRGTDVSLITYGGTLGKTLEAAELLSGEGIECEVIDLRILRPLDEETITGSVRRTHRAVIVDEGWRSGSISAEITARIVEKAFYELDAPVERVCSEEVPIPYSKHLEDEAIPQVADVVAATRKAMNRE